MIVKSLPSGPINTNAYVVFCEDTRQALIIDPAPDSFRHIEEFINAERLKPVKIILTHSHWDHIGDVSVVKAKYDVPVCIHKKDSPNLISPGSDGLGLPVPIEGVTPDLYLKEGDLVHCGNEVFEVIETPGHTPGGICLYCQEAKVLMSGDTLFRGSMGNLSLPGCVPHLMSPSLKKLSRLPPDTKVYSGHGSSTTIGRESWLEKI